MYANLEFITQHFDKYNKEIFANTLPQIPLRIGSSRRTMGTLRYRKTRHRGKISYSDFCLTISSRFDLPQNVIEDTLIHEMIHLYIFKNELEDSSSHGPVFRTLMKTINQRHGRNISVSHRTSESESASDTATRHHYILLSTFNSMETYITLVSRTKIFEIHRALFNHPDIDHWQWLYSTDPHFNRFPRSRSLKFYKISPQTLAKLEEARICKCDGQTFKLANPNN